MWAAAENNAAAVEWLLAAGAERDATSADGEFTALTFAVRAGAIETTRALLAAGAPIDETLEDGTSLLVLAATNAHYELANVLLEAGADPDAAAQGWTALHQIAWSRRWNMGFNLPGPAQTGDLDGLEFARLLVAAGADIDARVAVEPKDGNRNKLNRIGATAFLLAAKACDVPLMRALLDLGADASIATDNGSTALMAAAGVGIWAPGENPGTPEEALAAVTLAFEAGSNDINAANAEGDTALHGAVYRGGGIAVIEFLAARGAKLDAVNSFGWMPVTAADGLEYTPDVLKRYPEAAALLRRLMAEQGLAVPASTQPGFGAD
jgi:ankyrin repeat protein